MSPLSWAEPARYDADEIDRIRDWAASRCDGPTTVRDALRLWEARPSTHLANRDARAADTAGRLTTHGGHHE